MKKINEMLIIALFLFVVSSCTISHASTIVSKPSYQNNETILVDLKGEVNYPGLYQIEYGSTLYDLIALAGGFTKNADTNKINLVKTIEENQMIIIPKVVTDPEKEENTLININTANVTDLCKIPGIGNVKANNIIRYRNEIGYFNSIEEIKNVSGIGEELFSQIKDYICV